jgi:uncharacterized protein (TIGR00269 family)
VYIVVKCSKCDGDAVINLAYSDVNLCKKHFCDSFEKRFNRTVREFRLIKKGDRVGVAISGGKDSTTMLHLLKKIADEMRVKLIAISVDEGIEGYRSEGLETAQKACRKLGVGHKIFSFKKEIGFTMDEIAKKKKRLRTCSYCGVFRRWILNKAARELKLNKLAVGHNLDDAAQTVLMNILRNEPMRLARFGPSGGIVEDGMFVDRIKPLIRIPEREVAIYSVVKGMDIKFMPCPYATEAFRGRVRDFLNKSEEEFPGTKFKAFNSFMSIKDALEEKFKGNGSPRKCKECGELSSKEICVKCEMVQSLKLG